MSRNQDLSEASPRPAFRVLGGKNARHWPFIANILVQYDENLEFGEGHTCGGTLISDRIVLTSAHCVDWKASQLRVVLGDYRQDIEEINEVTSGVAKIVSHPSHNAATFENDIALLYLKDSVSCTKERTPITLSFPEGADLNSDLAWKRQQESTGQLECYMIGWGPTLEDEDMNTLGELKLQFQNHSQCKADFQSLYDRLLPEGLGCMPIPMGTLKMGCSGDSGGPIVCKSGDLWKLSGVATTGMDCTNATSIEDIKNDLKEYGLLFQQIEVSYFMPWIHEMLKRDGMLAGFIESRKKCESFSRCEEVCKDVSKIRRDV